MIHPHISMATKAQAEAVVRWLRDEHLNELEGKSGFYYNRAAIRKAARETEMMALILGRSVIGFSLFSPYGIDIFEIRSKHRRRGYGRHFAEHIIQSLFAKGSKELKVQCVPEESQHFWRALGFVDQEERHHSMGRIALVLRKPNPTVLA